MDMKSFRWILVFAVTSVCFSATDGYAQVRDSVSRKFRPQLGFFEPKSSSRSNPTSYYSSRPSTPTDASAYVPTQSPAPTRQVQSPVPTRQVQSPVPTRRYPVFLRRVWR
jgi:hypothetical protein